MNHTNMEMKMIRMILMSVMLLGAVACGKPEVSFDTLETARSQAKENATYNATNYRKDTDTAGCKIYARGDSTQVNDCPQGDGWASMDLICDSKTIKLKCSTVSLAVGCMTQTDFESKSYANDDGHCQPINKVPFPIKKLVQ